ncbi:GLPGLI family protein [Myroides profundi]|uniref:GLPGLI family protein n=1 Tax=Myroides profundi TaxID=480520 RepID=A0AAJ5BED0_MYRPR|nr:GLPGLI family protein [Myroides profundi]AJH15523.1 hypothetical protein MPR_2352 [Myroides profundi]SER07780.1 GLPGLI family protein [Myroides profundi]
MSKIILIIATILYTTSIIAQEQNLYLIEYKEINNNFLKTISNDGELHVDLNNKTTLYNQNNFVFNNKSYRETGISQGSGGANKRLKSALFLDFKKDSLYTSSSTHKELLITEAIPVIKWELLDETKEIEGGIILNKATSTFRGRDYIAWYSLDYPMPYGPWKFSGLPGLIFEIEGKSHNSTYTWILVTIKKENDTEKTIFDLNKNTISLQKHAEKEQIESTEKANLMSKRLQTETGLKMESESTTYYRIGPELIYEWEIQP